MGMLLFHIYSFIRSTIAFKLMLKDTMEWLGSDGNNIIATRKEKAVDFKTLRTFMNGKISIGYMDSRDKVLGINRKTHKLSGFSGIQAPSASQTFYLSRVQPREYELIVLGGCVTKLTQFEFTETVCKHQERENQRFILFEGGEEVVTDYKKDEEDSNGDTESDSIANFMDKHSGPEEEDFHDKPRSRGRLGKSARV